MKKSQSPQKDTAEWANPNMKTYDDISSNVFMLGPMQNKAQLRRAFPTNVKLKKELHKPKRLEPYIYIYIYMDSKRLGGGTNLSRKILSQKSPPNKRNGVEGE